MKYLPMLASIGTKKDLERKGYIYEPKLDGYRALLYVGKEAKLFTRNEHDITEKFPELENIKKAITAKSCVLDGELVSYNDDGLPDFQLVQGRDQLGSRLVIAQRSTQHPVTFIVFDILEYNGKSVMDKPLAERKKLLTKIITDTDRIKTIPSTTDGKKLWREMTKLGVEGVMAKEADSIYYPGKRKKVWLKVKQFQTADCVIIGYTQEKRLISALALGMYDKKGNLQYIGNVGTGFSEREQKELHQKLKVLVTKKVPVEGLKLKEVKWVKPELVCEVKYIEFTKDKKLRTPVYLHLRSDKDPEDCKL